MGRWDESTTHRGLIMKLTIEIKTKDVAFQDSPLMNRLEKREAIRSALQGLLNKWNAHRLSEGTEVSSKTIATYKLEEEDT